MEILRERSRKQAMNTISLNDNDLQVRKSARDKENTIKETPFLLNNIGFLLLLSYLTMAFYCCHLLSNFKIVKFVDKKLGILVKFVRKEAHTTKRAE